MTTEQVQTAIDLMRERGISQNDAMQVLALTAQKLQDAKLATVAKSTNRTLDEVRAAELGKQLGAAFNARHFGRK